MDNPLMDVHLNNGGVFLGCEATEEPVHESGLLVSFCVGEKIMIYPLTAISHMAVYEGPKDEL